MPDDPPKTARSEGYRHDPTAFPSLPQAGPRYGWQLPLKPPDLCAAATDAAVSVSEFRRVSRTQSTDNLIRRAYDGQICVCTQLKARRLVCPGVNGWSVLCTSVESSKHQWMGCVRCRNQCRVLSRRHTYLTRRLYRLCRFGRRAPLREIARNITSATEVKAGPAWVLNHENRVVWITEHPESS